MNEPDLMNNKFQLHEAMEEARDVIGRCLTSMGQLTGREYRDTDGYTAEDAECCFCCWAPASTLPRKRWTTTGRKGKARRRYLPCPASVSGKESLSALCRNAKTVMARDRQDSYGAGGGNLTLELKAALQSAGSTARVLSRIYGLGGRDFYVEDAVELLDGGSPRTPPPSVI